MCRFRPLNAVEVANGGGVDILINDNTQVFIKKVRKSFSLPTSIPNPQGANSDMQPSGTHSFGFDHVFDISASQNEVYANAARPVVESVFDGFNGTIMAYGQTSSGKTFTMEGKSKKDDSTRGIIPRIVDSVFEYINKSPESIEFMVKVSVLEIYMEELRDLLDPKTKK